MVTNKISPSGDPLNRKRNLFQGRMRQTSIHIFAVFWFCLTVPVFVRTVKFVPHSIYNFKLQPVNLLELLEKYHRRQTSSGARLLVLL